MVGKERKKVRASGVISVTVAIVTVVAIGGLSYFGLLRKTNNNSILSVTQSNGQLPKIRNVKKLKALLENASGWGGLKGGEMIVESSQSALNGTVSKSSEAKAETGSGSYSKTNVQVEGVDEGDIVKTDGEFIYRIRYNAEDSLGVVDIIKGYPVDATVKVATYIPKGRPTDLYINGDYMVVITDMIHAGKAVAYDKVGFYQDRNKVSVQVLSLKDKSKPKLLKNVSVDGYILSSRIIDKRLYLVTNKYVYYDMLNAKETESLGLPSYSDSADGSVSKTLDLGEIAYCPEALSPNYIIITSLNLKDLTEEAKVTAYLGQSNKIYCSEENLYITGYNSGRKGVIRELLGLQRDKEEEISTAVYKFNLKNGEALYHSKASVPGTIINQFSMDESNDEFRIATTRGYLKDNKGYVTDNNLYVLDKGMKLKGKIENIAEGERIYSTRFMGSRAYIVTFRNVDPLFVIDLSDGKSPKILGELKIPGFSNYLHPYDENHIIGFGMDTELIGAGTESERAMTQGMKMAVFDITDVTKPKEKFVEIIGSRGTYSELLYNHKALLFDREKELLAIPVQVAEHNNSTGEYKELFQGAYVYNLNLLEGFKLKGKLSHTTKEANSMGYYYDWNKSIQRILYIEDYLYTLSNNRIMIHDIKYLNLLGDIQY